MNAQQRRDYILERLKAAAQPVSATALAGELGVSRQIIVGDVALLRAGGAEITATPRGYMAQGCTVLDVVVEHPVYGQITGRLDLSSRYEVSEFIRRVNQSRSHPLSDLTDGIHLHTVSCPDEGAWRRVLAALEREGFLLS